MQKGCWCRSVDLCCFVYSSLWVSHKCLVFQYLAGFNPWLFRWNRFPIAWQEKWPAFCECKFDTMDFFISTFDYQRLSRTIWMIQPDFKFFRHECDCNDFKCECCLGLKEDHYSLNETLCVETAYLPEDLGIEVGMKLIGNVDVSTTLEVSVRNPPPICLSGVKLPDIKVSFLFLIWKHYMYSNSLWLTAKSWRS